MRHQGHVLWAAQRAKLAGAWVVRLILARRIIAVALRFADRAHQPLVHPINALDAASLVRVPLPSAAAKLELGVGRPRWVVDEQV